MLDGALDAYAPSASKAGDAGQGHRGVGPSRPDESGSPREIGRTRWSTPRDRDYAGGDAFPANGEEEDIVWRAETTTGPSPRRFAHVVMMPGVEGGGAAPPLVSVASARGRSIWWDGDGAAWFGSVVEADDSSPSVDEGSGLTAVTGASSVADVAGPSRRRFEAGSTGRCR